MAVDFFPELGSGFKGVEVGVAAAPVPNMGLMSASPVPKPPLNPLEVVPVALPKETALCDAGALNPDVKVDDGVGLDAAAEGESKLTGFAAPKLKPEPPPNPPPGESPNFGASVPEPKEKAIENFVEINGHRAKRVRFFGVQGN